MSGFTPEWLDLREPTDAAARSTTLCAELAGGKTPRRKRRIVDLGSGTGANLRYLAPQLGGDQQWLLVDHDQALLDYAPRATQDWAEAQGFEVSPHGDGIDVRGGRFFMSLCWRKSNIAVSLEKLITPDVDLVTGSALLDLVSVQWIEQLVQHCLVARCALLMALSYDGRMIWQPALRGDETIRELFNRHQRTDKGFGRAAGPDGATLAARQLRDAGFHVLSARSDWRLTNAEAKLQRMLLSGCAQAATEMNQSLAGQINEWLDQRLALIAHADGEATIGHVDLLALP